MCVAFLIAECLQTQVCEPSNQAQCESSLMHQACARLCLLSVSLISLSHQYAYSSRGIALIATALMRQLFKFLSPTHFFPQSGFIILYSDRGQPEPVGRELSFACQPYHSLAGHSEKGSRLAH